MHENVITIEKKAQELLEQGKHKDASALFHQAGNIYVSLKKHHAAALCLASAASCSAQELGDRLFYYAANDYEKAARQAYLTGDLVYTVQLYKHAADCHERDKDFDNFARCFQIYQEYSREYLKNCFLSPNKNLFKKSKKNRIKKLFNCFVQWLALSVSYYVWGHGEQPYRTVISSVLFILFCAVIYTQTRLVEAGTVFQPDFLESIFFSASTFTAGGYIGVYAVGFSRVIVVIESFAGLFIIPLFIMGLCRKYLRF